eukprot:1091281-Pleurochrysis_carterae.AAC.1
MTIASSEAISDGFSSLHFLVESAFWKQSESMVADTIRRRLCRPGALNRARAVCAQRLMLENFVDGVPTVAEVAAIEDTKQARISPL